MHIANMSVLFSILKDIPKFNLTPFGLLCARVQAEERPGGQAPAGLSEAARSELMELCEDQFAQLEKVKLCLSLTNHALLPGDGANYVSLCCSFRMRLYCVRLILVRIRKSR